MAYVITFEDGSTFDGGNPQDSRWDEIPNKLIASLEYSLTPFMKYKFSGFVAYNHLVERVRGVGNSVDIISKVVIMGMVDNRVYEILLDRTGGVYQVVTAIGKEYSPESKLVDGKFGGWVNAKPVTVGWKNGVKGEAKLEKISTEE
jgi:hypothetical protein